jgi:hypothetical protein
MSHYAIFNDSTKFRLADGEASERAIAQLIEKHMDDYPVELSDEGEGFFSLDFDGGDVGDSFNDRVSALVKAMSDHVLDAFVVTVKNTDTSSDDNREEIFGGPSEDSVAAFRRDRAIKDALDMLKRSAPDVHALLKGALGGGAGETPKIVITVEGGVVQSVMAERPVQVLSVDYDAQGTAEEELADLPQEDGTCAPAIVGISEAEVNPRRVAELSYLIHLAISEQEQLRQRIIQKAKA